MPCILSDFHTHTVNDPRDKHVWHTAEELIDRAAFHHYGALAVTLHGRQHYPDSWRQYAADKGITLLPGVEQDIEGFHVLLLNFDRDAANGIRTFADLAVCRRPENLVIAAHPFFPGKICLQEKLIEYAELFDAIEVTGYYHRLWDPNAKARQAASRLNLPLVGNSDTHALDQFGSTASSIEIEGDATASALVAGVKAGKVEVKTRSLSALEMGRIGYKVVGRGYLPWIDYKSERGQLPAP